MLIKDIQTIMRGCFSIYILTNCYKNYHAEFDLQDYSYTCLNKQCEVSVTDRRMDTNNIKALRQKKTYGEWGGKSFDHFQQFAANIC